MTSAFLLSRIIFHGGRHTLGGAVADTNHAAGAIGFVYDAVPGQRREAHEPVLHGLYLQLAQVQPSG